MQEALLGPARGAAPPLCPGSSGHPGSDAGENRFQPVDDLGLPPDHQAVAALQAEHAPAGPYVDKVKALLLQFGGVGDVVVIVRITAVDDDVARGQQRRQFGDRTGRVPGWHHDPHRSGDV